LGVAIFDKYCEKILENWNRPYPDSEETFARVATCLWIAWKFNEVSKMPLRKLFLSVPATDIKMETLIDMESDILMTIDFELPI
jgi:hypothetical protein